MKIVVDMNLSPRWAAFLTDEGHNATHWSQVGAATATDAEIFAWAATQGAVVFTHDLDFGAILAASSAKKPSVIQLREQDVRVATHGALVLKVLQRYAEELSAGVLLSVNASRQRIRMLPLT